MVSQGSFSEEYRDFATKGPKLWGAKHWLKDLDTLPLTWSGPMGQPTFSSLPSWCFMRLAF